MAKMFISNLNPNFRIFSSNECSLIQNDELESLDLYKRYLKQNNIEVRKLRSKEIILFIEYKSFDDFMEKEDISDGVKSVYILNSRFDAVTEINSVLYKKYYAKHL